MRAMLILLLSGACLLGCKHSKSPESALKEKPSAVTRAEKVPRKAAPRETTEAQQPTPINESSGRVASVNPGLRFVVVDFAFNPVPQVDQRMSVYRQGQKVGEIKISSQARNNIIAADITAGEAAIGDEVRP